MASESVPAASAGGAPNAQPGKVRFVEKCQPWLTALSPIVAVLSFFAGTLYSAANLEETTAATQAGQWRQALQTVNFDEKNLISTAFLMQSFEDDAQYGGPARQIEQTVLGQTTQPATFDLVYFNMLAGLKTPDQIGDLTDVGINLKNRLYSLYNAYNAEMKAKQPNSQPVSIDDFMQKPMQLYTTAAQRDELNRVLVVMWELDSFSDGMACVWGAPHDSGDRCPRVPLNGMDLSGLLIVNHAVPAVSGANLPQAHTTCPVESAMTTQGGYECGSGSD